MKKLFYLGAMSALLLSACGEEKIATVTPDEFKQLEKGMSPEEVEKIVGGKSKNPDAKEDDDLFLFLEYDGENGIEKDSAVSLIFKDGKLTDISEDGLTNKRVELTKEPEVKEEPITSPSEVENVTEESSPETIDATIEAFKSNDFMKFADAFYSLNAPERSDLYRSTVEGATVTWSGIITDLETVKDSIIIMGKTDAYNGADWVTLGSENEDLLPYVIIVEMNNPSVKNRFKKGDVITFKGQIGARGDKKMKFNWKLYKGEIVK